MISSAPPATDLPASVFRDPARWTRATEYAALILDMDGPEGLRLRLYRNRGTVRPTLLVPTLELCPQRGGLWRRRVWHGKQSVDAALFPQTGEALLLHLADLAFGEGARETRRLCGRLAQAFAEARTRSGHKAPGWADVAEVVIDRKRIRLRPQRTGWPTEGAWHDLPPRLSARALLALQGSGIRPILPVPPPAKSAHQRLADRLALRAEIADLGEDPDVLLGGTAPTVSPS